MNFRKELSCEEINLLLKELHNNIADVIPSNPNFSNYFYLYRWLLQNKMKVDQTASRIRKSIEWRKTENVEELAEREWAFFAPGLENYVSFNIEGFSKSGQPVSVLNGNSINVRELLEKYSKASLLRGFYQLFAKQEKNLLDHYKTGPTIDSHINSNGNPEHLNPKPNYNPTWKSAAHIHINSYKDICLENAYLDGSGIFREGSTVGMTLFPALVETGYLVNLNKISRLVLGLIKPILVTEAMDLHFYGTNKSEWSKVVLERIDADQLLEDFGGTRIAQQEQDSQASAD